MKPKKSLLGLVVVFALWIESAVAQVQPVAPEARMPSIRAQTLNQRELTLPQELPGEVTLVLMAFEREQQVKVDTWIVGLNLKQNPFAWVETPVIEPKNWLVRAFITARCATSAASAAISSR